VSRLESQSWLPLQFEFLSGIPQPMRQRRLLLTIQAYIDDSGVIGTDPIFVLAGFMARAEQWAAFSDAWKSYLDEPPSLQYLKMNEAAKLKGEFRGWTDEQRDRKLRGLVEIIKRFPPSKAIYALIDLIAWEEIMAPGLAKPMANPYYMGFHVVLSGVCHEVVDSGQSDEIELIFDKQVIFGPRIALWYPVVKDSIATAQPEELNRIANALPPSPMFRDDRKFVPLQAADILAWLIRTAFSDRLPGPESAFRPKDTGFGWIAAELSPVIPMSDYSSDFGHERMARVNELSKEFHFAPELLEKWRRHLGITRE
jgi:hypothetical protein